jgi:Zn-finger nucleic acid-binding protein
MDVAPTQSPQLILHKQQLVRTMGNPGRDGLLHVPSPETMKQKSMNCPACGGTHFAPVKIEGDLPADICIDCEGVWVELDLYRAWRKGQTSVVALDYAGEIGDADDTVRLCASTGRLMTRIKVSHGDPLRLDYSVAAQAVWFDKGEWERLVQLDLYDRLDAILSERWQAELKLAASSERTEQAMRARFGDAGYEHLAGIRTWLAIQPNRTEMLAFLNAKD